MTHFAVLYRTVLLNKTQNHDGFRLSSWSHGFIICHYIHVNNYIYRRADTQFSRVFVWPHWFSQNLIVSISSHVSSNSISQKGIVYDKTKIKARSKTTTINGFRCMSTCSCIHV